jgi:hypothetical protein
MASCVAISEKDPVMSNSIEMKGWPPTVCGLPDLSALRQDKMLRLAERKIVGMTGPPVWLTETLRINYVRVTDHLIHEYEKTREELTLYVNEAGSGFLRTLHLIRATGHFEAAVTNMVRAIGLARRLRRAKDGPPIEKNVQVLRDDVANRVGDLRNAIEHIFGSNSDPVPPAWLILKNEKCELEGIEILYGDFAHWIEQLDKIAVEAAEYQGPPSSSHAQQ